MVPSAVLISSFVHASNWAFWTCCGLTRRHDPPATPEGSKPNPFARAPLPKIPKCPLSAPRSAVRSGLRCRHRSRASISEGVLALEPYNPKFEVDGLALGGSVYPESAIYKAYKCRASDDFTGFTWCASSHETGQFRTVHLVGDDPPYQRQQSRLPHASDRSGILPTGRR